MHAAVVLDYKDYNGSGGGYIGPCNAALWPHRASILKYNENALLVNVIYLIYYPTRMSPEQCCFLVKTAPFNLKT